MIAVLRSLDSRRRGRFGRQKEEGGRRHRAPEDQPAQYLLVSPHVLLGICIAKDPSKAHSRSLRKGGSTGRRACALYGQLSAGSVQYTTFSQLNGAAA